MTEEDNIEVLDGILRAAKTLRYTPQDSKLWHLAKKRLIELVGQLEKD
jgi:hypothetical protein